MSTYHIIPPFPIRCLSRGTRLGAYEIVALIGTGGMGEVYRARDPRLGRSVALKVLPSAFSADGDRLARFEQEARAAATLDHPNILSVHDVGHHAGAPYIVSELLDAWRWENGSTGAGCRYAKRLNGRHRSRTAWLRHTIGASSRSVGFFADGKLKKTDASGGPVQTLCDAPAGEGGTWNRDGIIVFAPTGSSGLFQVSATGGQPTAVTRLDSTIASPERSHRWPYFLPDGRRILFGVLPGNEIRLGSLDSAASTRLLAADSRALYAPPGYVLSYGSGR